MGNDSAKKTAGRGAEEIPLEKVRKLASEANAAIKALNDALSMASPMTSIERQHSNGKLKDGEETAIRAIVETVTRFPEPFRGLKGNAKILSEGLEMRGLLSPIVENLQKLQARASDALLRSGESIKTASSPLYEIASALAKHDPELANALQPARQFYQAPAQAAARTRKKKKQGTEAGK